MTRKRRPHDELKPAIVAEARAAIDRGGLAAVSARGLAEAVGVSVGTLYNLFDHLDGIVRAVNLESMADLHAGLAAALRTAEDGPEARLTALAEAYFDFALDKPHRWEALFRYRPETPRDPALGEAEAGLFQLLRQAAGQDDRDVATDEALRTLWAAVHGVAELAIARRDETGEGDLRAHARLVVMAGLRGFHALRDEGLL